MRLIVVTTCTLAFSVFCVLTGCSTGKPDFSNLSDKDLVQARQAVLDQVDGSHIGDDQLKGIKTVTLALHYLQNWKKGVSPSEFEILRPITLKLRMAGLKVVPFDERVAAQKLYIDSLAKGQQSVETDAMADMPLIQQEIQTYKWVDNTTVVSIETLLFDDAILARDMSVKRSVVTWRTDDINTEVVDNANLRAHILKISMEQIDTLLSAWLKQNGR